MHRKASILFNFFDQGGNTITAGYYYDPQVSSMGQWVLTKQGTEIQIKVPELVDHNPHRVTIASAEKVLQQRGLL